MFMEIGENWIPVGRIFVPIVGSIALFSFLAVASWSDARRKEREAYYRSETLKKIAESSGEGRSRRWNICGEGEKRRQAPVSKA